MFYADTLVKMRVGSRVRDKIQSFSYQKGRAVLSDKLARTFVKLSDIIYIRTKYQLFRSYEKVWELIP